jgi:pimeloyl-ACP methyl ester carboxylesterase
MDIYSFSAINRRIYSKGSLVKNIVLIIALLAFKNACASIEYNDVKLADGVIVQTCARFPDPVIFPGPRPAVMINLGSGLYDYCRDRTIKSDYVDAMLAKGVVVFISLKRGIRHNPADNTFTSDIALFSQATLPQLKADALQSFEHYQNDPRIDSCKMALWGGSEGTLLSVFIASKHPEVSEVHLASSMIEDFPTLYARQMYEILPRDLISSLDQNHDGMISKSEVPSDFLKNAGLDNFEAIDANHDSLLSANELSNEIRSVIARSLETHDNTFFLSDFGGRLTANWVQSAMNEEPLGPRVLALNMPVHLYHGTADENALVQPVYALEQQAKSLGRTNIQFTYYPGLTHELTRDVIAQMLIQISENLSKSSDIKTGFL